MVSQLSSTLVHVQQRRILRRSLRVDCQVVREHDFKLLGSRGVDLSPDGMLVMAQERVLTGEPVVVSFRLPRSSYWFDAEATVARVVHGRRPGDLGRCFGLSFESIEPDVQAFLRRALRGVPPPLPTREPRVDYAASVALAALS
ncbi:MAG TPA: PilZ domain-containing protein [Polyangiaceae bacterium]|jgi:c-di-GMP-binding flagellar brake protein YcgR